MKFAEAKGQQPILTAKQISDIFSNFDSILQINEKFLTELENRIANIHGNVPLGDIFCKFIPLFKLYSIYVSNFEKSNEIIAEQIQKNKLFEEFLKESGSHGSNGKSIVNLQGMLLCPIQRIPRYKLLLEDLLKNTNKEDSDFELLEKSIALIQDGK